MKKFFVLYIVTIFLFPNPFCSITKAYEVDSKVICSFTNLPILLAQPFLEGDQAIGLSPVTWINDIFAVLFSNFLPSLPLSLGVFFGEDYFRNRFKKKKGKHYLKSVYLLPFIWILVGVVFFAAYYLIGYISPLQISG